MNTGYFKSTIVLRIQKKYLEQDLGYGCHKRWQKKWEPMFNSIYRAKTSASRSHCLQWIEVHTKRLFRNSQEKEWSAYILNMV